MAKPSKKRLPRREETIRKVIPVSIITIKDKFKTDLQKKLKPKHAKAINDIVVFEIMMNVLKDVPASKFIEKVPKKYLKNKKK